MFVDAERSVTLWESDVFHVIDEFRHWDAKTQFSVV